MVIIVTLLFTWTMDTFLYQYIHSFTAILMAAFYFIVRIHCFLLNEFPPVGHLGCFWFSTVNNNWRNFRRPSGLSLPGAHYTAFLKVRVKVKVTQSCLTLCNPMDYTVHGILQARILEWVAFPFSRGSSQPRD